MSDVIHGERRGRDACGLVRRQKVPGRGSLHHSTETRRIVVGFDPETFEQVRGLALKAGTSFAEQTRLLVEFGLETVEASLQEDSPA